MARGASFIARRQRWRGFAAAVLVFAFLWLGFSTVLGGVFGPPKMTLKAPHGLRGSTVHVHGDVTRDPSDRSGGWLGAIYFGFVTTDSRGVQLDDVNNPLNIAADGTFDFNFVVPGYDNSFGTFHPGGHTVAVCAERRAATLGPAASFVPACGNDSVTALAEATYTINKPVLTINRDHGRAGEARTAHGLGFIPDAAGSGGSPYVRGTWDPGAASETGLFFATVGAPWDLAFSVPWAATFGTHTIEGCNDGKGCYASETDTAKFTVTYPRISLSSHHGVVGDTITVDGTGMFAGQPLRFFFGTSADPFNREFSTSKQTNANGDFSNFTFHVPPHQPGTGYMVTACTVEQWASPPTGDCATGLNGPSPAAALFDPNSPYFDSPQAAFTIVSPPTPSPTPSPTPTPTATPTATPTPTPTRRPTPQPTQPPTPRPTPQPTPPPTPQPTPPPTPQPTTAPPTESPSGSPSPSAEPSASPSLQPTIAPTEAPTPEITPDISPEPTASPTPEATGAPLVTPAPTPEPSPSPVAAALVLWPQHLHPPSSGGLGNLATLGGSGLLALLIAFLVPFPGTLFNKTVEANYSEIQGWLSRLQRGWRNIVRRVAVGPLRPLSAWFSRNMTGVAGVWVFLILTALVYGFLSPTFGLDVNSLALFLGLAVGLGFITAAFDLPLRVYHRRRSRDVGVLRALWWTLGVAVICVVISRLSGFQPGYLYGLVISIVFVTEISTRDEGFGVWLASIWLLVLSFGAWLLLGFVRSQGAEPFVQLFIETVLVTFVVAGVEALVIGLLPIRFMPGHPLFEWRRTLWFPLFALSVFCYLLILIDPQNGYLSDDSRTPTIVGLIFLITFGAVSIGTWAYFRYRPARLGGDRPGEVPELPGPGAA